MTDDFGALFDAAAPSFRLCDEALWTPAGELAAAAADLRAGEDVLDVCCGAGASAIPAARAVGAGGKVLGVDLSEELLVQARAAAVDLPQVEFRHGEGTDPAVIGSGHDAVVCVFGVFFFPDMDAGGRALLQAARPGGRLVVGAWGEHALGSLGTVVSTALEPLRPAAAAALRDYVSPSAAIGTADALGAWLDGLGGTGTRVREHPRTVPLDADLAWPLVAGSAMRRLVEDLTEAETGEFRANLAVAVKEVPDLKVDTVIGVTTHPE